MRKNSILYLTLVCTIIGLGLYVLAELYYFYWLYWWYDVLVHFWVSLTGGLGLYWGFFHSGLILKAPPKFSVSLLVILLAVLMWGIAWEIFEYINGMTDSAEGYRLDTVNDLIFDSCGAVLAVLIVTREKSNG